MTGGQPYLRDGHTSALEEWTDDEPWTIHLVPYDVLHRELRLVLAEMRRLTDEHAVLRDHAERLLRQAFGDDDVADADERMAALLAALADRPHPDPDPDPEGT